MVDKMSFRVVSTKLTEEEHAKLLDECNSKGCTASNLIKDAILEKIGLKEKEADKKKELTFGELSKYLRSAKSS